MLKHFIFPGLSFGAVMNNCLVSKGMNERTKEVKKKLMMKLRNLNFQLQRRQKGKRTFNAQKNHPSVCFAG